jgi:hypothetical protein
MPRKKTPMPKSKKHPQEISVPAQADAPKRELTDLQSMICDLASDLIIRGGQPEDVDQILLTVSRHASRRMFPTIDHDTITNDEAGMRGNIAGWRKRIEKTLSEQMRMDLRSQLASHFNEFVWRARWHELHLMRDVLNEFATISMGPTNDEAECILAAAFMNQIGQGETTYVKVPKEHIKLVEEYAKLLDRVEHVLDRAKHPDAA